MGQNSSLVSSTRRSRHWLTVDSVGSLGTLADDDAPLRIATPVSLLDRLPIRRPRLVLSALVSVIAWLVVPDTLAPETKLLVAFDFGASCYLATIWIMMGRATAANIGERARAHDEGKWTILVLGSLIATAVLFAIGFEMHGVKSLPGHRGGLHVSLAAVTIVLSWVFMNTLFAVHYAHEYYLPAEGGGHAGGLQFPGQEHPDYWDFVYFSFVIGMTFQVSDVQITQRAPRRLAVAHGVLAFFFNVVILALVINICAGLV